MNSLLSSEHSHGGLSELLCGFGEWGRFLDEVLLHGILDTLKPLVFLFFTYLLMEFIEHKASDKLRALMQKSGSLGPLVGGALGAVPQCGFSAAASNLYTGRVITLGTLVAVFLSTSDEMLPVMLSGNVPAVKIAAIIGYKIAVGIVVGFAVDLLLRLFGRQEREIDIDELCENDNCHCENGILSSAIHHTLTVSLFILAVNVVLGAVLFFVPSEELSDIIPQVPVLTHLVAAIIGIIPNCATSVALTELAISGVITHGTMLSGLLSGAGIGLLVLFRMNRRIKENLLITLLIVIAGALFGALAELIPFLSL